MIMKKKINIAEVIAINDVLNNSKFKDLKIASINSLLELKFQLSKISKDKDEFIRESVESLKSDRFKELVEKQNKTNEEVKEFELLTSDLNKTMNSIMNTYLLKEVELNIENIESSELLLFCKDNDINMVTTEFLYNLFIL